MNSRALYQLPCTTPGKEMARAWQWQHATEGILALVYVSDIAKWYPTDLASGGDRDASSDL